MKMTTTRSSLAIELASLKGFDSPKIRSEQYATDSEIAATVLWTAYMQGDIEGKRIADMGCGTGILGIGALLLGASEVVFVDNDADALDICRENLKTFDEVMQAKAGIIESDISDFDEKVDVILQNPPFGTREKHADRQFLEKAFKIADAVYSIHKINSRNFIEQFSGDNGFKVKGVISFRLPLKQTYSFHKKKIHRIEAGCWYLVRDQDAGD